MRMPPTVPCTARSSSFSVPRALLVSLVAVSTSPAHTLLGQVPQPPDALKIVRAASFNELRAANGAHPFRYRLHSADDGKETVKEVVETKDGDVSRLIEKDGHTLDTQENQEELEPVAEAA